MKKITVAIVTLMFSMGSYAQVDSLHGGAKTGTMRESDADLNNINRNPKVQENPVKQDNVKVSSDERSTPQNKSHAMDSSGTSAGEQKKSHDNMQTPKPVQQQNSGVKTSPPAKQEPPKKAGADKDKMYLVPDSTMKKSK